MRAWRVPASATGPLTQTWPRLSALAWIVFALGMATGLLIGWVWLLARAAA